MQHWNLYLRLNIIIEIGPPFRGNWDLVEDAGSFSGLMSVKLSQEHASPSSVNHRKVPPFCFA